MLGHELRTALRERGADMVRFVDISPLSPEQTQGYLKAILICMVLSKKFVLDIYHALPTDSDEYLEKEQRVEESAEWLAAYIRQKGYRAYAQSENNNLKNGSVESGYINPTMQAGISVVPQKTIARLGGLGFIGKNNLLVTEGCGCALCMCTILTDAPVLAESHPLISSKCGACDICKSICPGKAIHGAEWTLNGGRESLVDVSKCCCALKCMAACPWTLKYAGARGTA